MNYPNDVTHITNAIRSLKPERRLPPSVVFGVLFSGLWFSIHAQSTAFTYQGRLDTEGAPANGIYDLRFAIYDAASDGAMVAEPLVNSPTQVSNGFFSVTLDFGAGVFTGGERWLEIGVQTNGQGAFEALAPRQALTTTPYAARALNADSATSVSGPVSAAQLTGTLASAHIASGTITTAMLADRAVGEDQLAAGAVTTSALADSAVTAAKVATTSNWFPLTLANPSPAINGYFGSAVTAMGSNRVLVGAYRNHVGATEAGAAYLFNISGKLLTTFTNPSPTAMDGFGFAVAAVGNDRVLIGAYQDDTGAPGAGVAYLFNTNGALLTTFANPAPALNDYFGRAVTAVGNDRVLIGADYDDTGATNAGAAYLFSTSGALQTTFTNPSPEANDYFGSALAALGNDRVLIAAVRKGFVTSRPGRAYLFSTDGTLLTTFNSPSVVNGGHFGSAVAAMGNDHVLIGASRVFSGKAYLFATNGTLITTFNNPSPTANDEFGHAVAAVGNDKVLIGAYRTDTGAPDAGAAYLFNTSGILLATLAHPAPALNDYFGHAVAAVGDDRMLIGAQRTDTGATDAGAVYLFSTETFTPGLIAEAVAARSISTASLADGAVTAAKVGGVLYSEQIPGLDASKLVSGTVADVRLSPNVALLNRSRQTFTGPNIFTDRVGIGTAASASTLRVQGAGSVGDIWLSPTTSGGNADIFLSENPSGSFGIILRHNGTDNTLDFVGVNNSVENTEPVVSVGRGNTSGMHVRNHVTVGGNLGIGTTNPSQRLHVIGNILATGTITPSSDRNLKKNLQPVDAVAMLERVVELPVQQWTYQSETDDVRHVGPVAQDFHAAFGVGANDTTIATVDADGVALAAIQGLNQKVDRAKQQAEAELAAIRAENAALRARLESLERFLRQQFNPDNP